MKKDATGAPKQGAHRRYGPLLKLAAQIATESDGRPCSVKTVYAVKRGRVVSARVSDALLQAELHPEYLDWKRRHERVLAAARRIAKRILDAGGRAA